ncbi:MAG: hypothetical protein UH211_11830 [Agathobacter sp.]|nr:hypothetical protein [Agathobacter sp.]
MNKKKLPIVLAGVATGLLLLSATGSTRAALSYISDNYIAQVDIKSIGVTLTENGQDISWRDYTHKDDAWNEGQGVLLENLLTNAGDEEIVLNKVYPEELAVRNSGTIDEYVRVVVTKYWLDSDGVTKRTDLDPAIIDLHFTNNGWVEDETAATSERNVFYYTNILPSGETAPAFADTIKIGDELAKKVTETTKTENGCTTIETSYVYDGVVFVLRADVDAVQTHNAEDAIMSAWGVDVNISGDGSLSLN